MSRSNKTIHVIILAVVVLTAAAAAGHAWLRIRRAAEQIPVLRTAPDFELQNQDGETVRLSQLTGKAKLLTFIYVRCSVATQCPLTTQNVRAVQEATTRAGAADRVVFLSATFDPQTDSPAMLKGYGKMYDADFSNWHFLTGAPSVVAEMCGEYGVIYEETASSGLEFRHSVLAYLIDDQNRIRRVYFANAWKPEDVAADMLSLLKEDH